MKTMKETNCTTWGEMMQIPTRAKTTNGIIRAIKNYTDCFNNLTQEEMVDFVNSEWVTRCSDGVIIWED